MIMALCGLPGRPNPDEPALDVKFQYGKTCQMRQGRGAQRSRADVCTFARKWKCE